MLLSELDSRDRRSYSYANGRYAIVGFCKRLHARAGAGMVLSDLKDVVQSMRYVLLSAQVFLLWIEKRQPAYFDAALSSSQVLLLSTRYGQIVP